MKQFLLRSAVVILPLAATPAYADITFSTGNTGGIDEVNILFEAAEIGTALDHGEVDHSGAAVPSIASPPRSSSF